MATYANENTVVIKNIENLNPVRISEDTFRAVDDSVAITYSIAPNGRVRSILQGGPWEQPFPLELTEANCAAVRKLNDRYSDSVRTILDSLERYREDPRSRFPALETVKFRPDFDLNLLDSERTIAVGFSPESKAKAVVTIFRKHEDNFRIEISSTTGDFGLDLTQDTVDKSKWIGEIYKVRTDQTLYTTYATGEQVYKKAPSEKIRVSIHRGMATTMANYIAEQSGINLSPADRIHKVIKESPAGPFIAEVKSAGAQVVAAGAQVLAAGENFLRKLSSNANS